jgi:MFS family permease
MIYREYKIGYAIVSLIFISNAIGFLSAAPFTEALQARLGRAKALMIAEALMLAGYIVILLTPPYPVVVVWYRAPLNFSQNVHYPLPAVCGKTDFEGGMK